MVPIDVDECDIHWHSLLQLTENPSIVNLNADGVAVGLDESEHPVRRLHSDAASHFLFRRHGKLFIRQMILLTALIVFAVASRQKHKHSRENQYVGFDVQYYRFVR